jgi:hypothetical protein
LYFILTHPLGISPQSLPVTRIVDALMDFKQSPLTEVETVLMYGNSLCTHPLFFWQNYLYLDPKVTKGGPIAVPKSRSPFEEAFVFMVGGGNYIEYQNLQDYSQRGELKRTITYGVSELVSPTEFLSQLAALGQQQ